MSLAQILASVTAFFSLVAALFAVLTFLKAKSTGTPAGSADASLADAVRTEADRTRLAAEEQARSLRQELADTIERFRKGVTDDMDKMGKDAAQNRDALRHTIEGKLDAAEVKSTSAARDLRTELIDNFGKTSEVLSKSLKDFGEGQGQRLDGIKKEVTGMSEKQVAGGEQLRKTVEERLDQLRLENTTKLDEMRQTVDEKLQTTLEKRLSESFVLVQAQLESVHKGLGEMQNLAVGVGDLKRVLTNVKTRGVVGEEQLAQMLEQFLSPEQYIRNAQVKAGSAERVEFAIKFFNKDSDGDLLLPIDAKFPDQDYDRLVQAAERADPDAVEIAAKALENTVRGFAKSMSEKYINPPETTDFAILYLPTEPLFAELLRRPGFRDQMQREYRVTIAGPTTLVCMLNAFQMGFRSLAIQKQSSEVWKVLGAVRTEFTEHGKVVARLQKQLGAASNTIDALGTRTKAMNRKLRDVETLPVGDAQTVLGLSAAALAAEEGDDGEAVE